jgi:hypothetical protein
MKHPFAHVHGLAGLVLWALASAANAAGQAVPLPDPADANATVPSTRYESVMATTPPARGSSPADNWKELNRTVGSYDSMSLTMGMAESHQATPEAAPAAAAAPAGSPKTEPDPHAHHRPGAAK